MNCRGSKENTLSWADRIIDYLVSYDLNDYLKRNHFLHNVCVGYRAPNHNTGSENTAIGYEASINRQNNS